MVRRQAVQTALRPEAETAENTNHWNMISVLRAGDSFKCKTMICHGKTICTYICHACIMS